MPNQNSNTPFSQIEMRDVARQWTMQCRFCGEYVLDVDGIGACRQCVEDDLIIDCETCGTHYRLGSEDVYEHTCRQCDPDSNEEDDEN